MWRSDDSASARISSRLADVPSFSMGRPSPGWDEGGLTHSRLDPDPQAQAGEHAGEIGSGSARRVAPMSIPPAVSASVWSPVGLPLTGNDQIAPVTRAASTTRTTPDLISHRSVVIVSRAKLFMIVMAFHQRLPGCHADRHALAAPRAVQRLRGHIGYAGFVQDADRIDWHRLAALTRLAGPTDSFTMVVTN